MRNKKKGIAGSLKAVSLVGSFGLTMGASILLGYYAGSYLDRIFETSPWFMILLLLLCMLGAFVKFIQMTKETTGSGTARDKVKEQ